MKLVEFISVASLVLLAGRTPAESLEVPAAARTPAATAAKAESPAPAQPTPKDLQTGQLQILNQERAQSLALLASEMAAANRDSSEERADRIRRLQEDISGLDREISRASKAPPPSLRNTTPRAQPGRTEPEARATAIASPTTSDPVAFERWDVFKNFGKQGATP